MTRETAVERYGKDVEPVSGSMEVRNPPGDLRRAAPLERVVVGRQEEAVVDRPLPRGIPHFSHLRFAELKFDVVLHRNRSRVAQGHQQRLLKLVDETLIATTDVGIRRSLVRAQVEEPLTARI